MRILGCCLLGLANGYLKSQSDSGRFLGTLQIFEGVLSSTAAYVVVATLTGGSE
jgi:hypothetical protein